MSASDYLLSQSDLKLYVAVAAGIFLSAAASYILARRSILRSYRVAVIGFPQVGKTSLITALFAYLFKRGIRGASIVPRGEETITRINAHIAEMESGKGVAPTRDQDVFAYRAEVQSRSKFGLLPTKYKLEIGDFPGEQSEAFIESDQPWLHNTKYFQWAMGADAFLFVVDSSQCNGFDTVEYVAHQQSAFRAAWQRLADHHIDGGSSLRNKAVILVYTKADRILDGPPHRFGAGAVPETLEDRTKKLHDFLDETFADFIYYVRRDAPKFKTVLTSVVKKQSLERIGIPEVADYMLPTWRQL